MSHVELVQVRTADGVRLDGALALTRHAAAQHSMPVDAVLAIHGTGSNFYSGTLFDGLAPKLLADGLPVLRVNTQGHDVVNVVTTLQGTRRLGSSLERVDDCRHDLVAWLEFLSTRGFNKVALLGHSLGATKAIYTLAHSPHPAAARLMAVSPPRLSYAHFVNSEKRDEYLSNYRTAQEHAAAGRGEMLIEIKTPMPFLVSAESYLDKYGPEEKYNLLRLIDRIKLPALFVFCGLEVEHEVAFRGLPEAVMGAVSPAQKIQVVTIAGANHVYTGQIEELSHKIRS